MRAFVPHTEDDIREMLAAVGVADVEALFAPIPAGCRHQGDLDMAPALAAALFDKPAFRNVIVILPADGSRSAQAVDDLRRRLADELPADLVQADTAWVARLQAMLDLVRRTVFLAGLFLALGVLIIVGNTIRLDIQNRRDEIEVSKLIGATDGFIRRPFLYTGAWYGILGGLLALGLVTGSLFALDDPVRRLSGLYGCRVETVSRGGRRHAIATGIAESTGGP